MLRQLSSLCQPVAAGDMGVAPAVYASQDNESLPAHDRGFEGVACVDDAARALELLALVHARTHNAAIAQWAAKLRTFVLALHDGQGGFYNFVKSWDGDINKEGPTSAAEGDTFWTARAYVALVTAQRQWPDPHAHDVIEMCHERGARAWNKLTSDLVSVHLLALLRSRPYNDATLSELERCTRQILACSKDGILLNYEGERDGEVPHMWGHIQEGVVARAATVLHDDNLLDVAVTSFERLVVPWIESGFDLPTVQSYGIASVAASCEWLGRATGDPRYNGWHDRCIAWFEGDNPAKSPVYDVSNGRVGDGIDDGYLNPHSGAESNVMAGFAYLDDAKLLVSRLTTCLPPPPA